MSSETHDNPNTLAAVHTNPSLDTKAEIRLKTESQSKTKSQLKTDSKTVESQGKANSKRKTDSLNKPEAIVSEHSEELQNKPEERAGLKAQTKSNPKSKSNSKTRSKSINKVDSIGKVFIKTQTTSSSKSKSDTSSNADSSKAAAINEHNQQQQPPMEHDETQSQQQVKDDSTSRPEFSKVVSTDGSLDSVVARCGSVSMSIDAGSSSRKSSTLAAPRESPTSGHNEKPIDPEETKGAEDPQSRDSDTKPKKSTSKKDDKSSVSLLEESNALLLPTKKNALYNTTMALEKLDGHPSLKIRGDGKYYLKMKDTMIEQHPKMKRNKRGDVIPIIKKEKIGVIENIVSRFCEDVLCISRAHFLPLTSQGERHVVWVGKKKANHIIRYLNGNGCYVVNRFPGDIFVKDKQVMGIILRDHMLMRSNKCYWRCGVSKEDILNPKQPNENEEGNHITYRICRHMVRTMRIDNEGCSDKGCFNFEKSVCRHLDVFIPEVQSFCTYNALQDFSNRLEDDLKGQVFICKPAYLYKGFGFRFFRTSAEFQEFYHMTEGKETSRHDFMVQRLVDSPYLFNGKKVDIRAFLLVITLRYRRVISFIHYGFCRVACADFEEQEDEDELQADEEQATENELEKKITENYENDMKMLVCTYQTSQEKLERVKRIENRQFYNETDDRSQELHIVWPKKEDLRTVKHQIKHIGIRISQAIENKVWDAFGCFQIFGLDLCVDEDLKVWLLEINSHAMSQVDTLSPTQRKVVPAVIMEGLGLVVETTYKSFHHLRLRKSPTNEFEETGFLFRQNYDFIFSTLAKKRLDYVWPKAPKKPNPPFFVRIGVVDQQIKNVDKRKKACLAMKIAVREEQLALKRKRNAKSEEES